MFLNKPKSNFALSPQNLFFFNVLIKFHDLLKKRFLERSNGFYNSHMKKNSQPRGGHVFQLTGIIYNSVKKSLEHFFLKVSFRLGNKSGPKNVPKLFCVTLFLTPHDPVSNSVEYHWETCSEEVS